MLFNPAHTVLNQRANARKSSVETTNLIGHWDPNDTNSYGGSGATYNNLVSAREDLKIYGATFVNTSPKHFTFDGSNDKIADIDTSDPYGDNFDVNIANPFAISMWLKFDNFTNSNILWSLGTTAADHVFCTMDNPPKTKIHIAVAGYSFHIESAFSAGYWYMVTMRVRHPYASHALVDFFVNGVLVEIDSEDTGAFPTNMKGLYTALQCDCTQDLDIGYNQPHGYPGNYMNNATKLGAILVYASAGGTNCLPNSAIWTNYLATKDTYK